MCENLLILRLVNTKIPPIIKPGYVTYIEQLHSFIQQVPQNLSYVYNSYIVYVYVQGILTSVTT